MKHSHSEGTVHLLATLGFFALCGFLIVWPNSMDTNIAIGILSWLLGLKTVANLILDAHAKMMHHGTWQSCGTKATEDCCGGGCCNA